MEYMKHTVVSIKSCTTPNMYHACKQASCFIPGLKSFGVAPVVLLNSALHFGSRFHVIQRVAEVVWVARQVHEFMVVRVDVAVPTRRQNKRIES